MHRWIYFIKFGKFLAIISSNILPAPFSLSFPSGMLRMYISVCFMEFHRSVYACSNLWFSSCSKFFKRFPHSSVGKESTCSAGDSSSVPGSRRPTGEGIGYPLWSSWASLVVQLVKNLPAMWETCVRSLGWEDPAEKGKVTHSSILAWRIPWTVLSMGLKRVRRLSIFHFRVLNGSTGISSHSLVLLTALLPKAHLALYSRMFGHILSQDLARYFVV